jgi:L-alanine-DL-glutamate epimerase-like enolase superfamily enzyme
MPERTLPLPSIAASPSDRIAGVEVSHVVLPLQNPVSDAKVATGRQKPLTEVAFLIVEMTTERGLAGLGFSYSKRAGGAGLYAHACEIAGVLLGEDPNDIDRLWTRLAWAGASVGRSGLAIQAIAAFDICLWDLKAKRADLSLAKLLGAQRDSVACYNTSGGFLSTPLEQVLDNVDRTLDAGIGGIKIKVGQPDWREDVRRVEAVRARIDTRAALMVDANQQWDRPTAMRMGRILESFDLAWIEEPLDAYDAEGHAALANALDTPIASGEMLASAGEHLELIRLNAVDIIQPDAPRVGGVSQFRRILTFADNKGLGLAPHFAMEIHIHLAATYPREPWVEHFTWLNPLFNERQRFEGGRMYLSDRPGLGVTLSEQARSWTRARKTFDHMHS